MKWKMNEEKKSKRVVGIIGGMGPEATILLISRVIAKTPADDDSDHVPLIIDCNTQVPSRIKAIIEKTGENPGPTIAMMAKGLEQNGACALAMPCNTAHHYKSYIMNSVHIPFLDMIELSASRLTSMKIKSAGVLASPAVQQTGIFDQAFSKKGIATLYPTNQMELLEAIQNVKKFGDNSSSRSILLSSAEKLVGCNADILVVACSELSIIADELKDRHCLLDTIDLLAEEIIKFSGLSLKGDSRSK